VRVVGEGGRGPLYSRKAARWRDARSDGLNRKRQRTGNDFTLTKVEGQHEMSVLFPNESAQHFSLTFLPAVIYHKVLRT
jgi:hypothetical protein